MEIVSKTEGSKVTMEITGYWICGNWCCRRNVANWRKCTFKI